MSSSLQEQYDKIYRYCYFKVRQTQLAEDLTQEAFLRFFGQNRYVSRGKPLAFLYTIARNLCIDAYRKTGREEARAFHEDAGGIIASDIEALETSAVIRAAMQALPDDQQEILLLRYANDLSMAEISLITGLSRFASRRKINAALAKMKELLREEDFR